MKPTGEFERKLTQHDHKVAQHDNDVLAIYDLLTDLQGTVDGHTIELDKLRKTAKKHSKVLATHAVRLDRLQVTVDGHTATLADHTATLAEHGQKLDEILEILRARP